MEKNCIKSAFPVVYRKGNKFEISSELDLDRKNDVWGYEIMPGIVIAKKCGSDTNVESVDWYNSKTFAETSVLHGKRGALPSRTIVSKLRARDFLVLRSQIQEMDKFLCNNGIDAETRSEKNPRYAGVIWCSEENDYRTAYYFSLATCRGNYGLKVASAKTSRLVVSFNNASNRNVSAEIGRRIVVR